MGFRTLFRERVLTTEVWLPRPRAEVFAFFANAGNLNALTPEWLNFTIVTPQPIEMRVGALIDYRLRIRGVPIAWRTRISAWEPASRFVDEQLKGPYLQWIHEHTFEERQDNGVVGTLCRDVVRYRHMGGPLVQAVLVGPDLEKVFAYRLQRLRTLTFAPQPSPQP